ncbi:hypothetical protein Vretifemale_18508 [Volvox reticuliferus]|uniref:DUF4472 domain-containing protein n=2 Tax=Volvox reticuliferus TaxID=1737510 RepID=A0A8J4CXA1_9CHLO|nr:hypothetical protein Vretifemale_18508 [Volvox reticuliferus]
MAVVDDRQALRDLLDSTSAEGDPNSMALHIAKLRDLEARLLAVRSENAELREEKQALQARLHKIHKAEAGDLQEKQELQEALIQSEEQRLQLARALIDFQMEYNEARQDWETIKYELETKLIETEARQQEVVDEEVTRLVHEREELEAMASELTRQLAQELQLRLQLEEELEAGVSEPGEQEAAEVRPLATEGRRAVDGEEQAGLRAEEERRTSEAEAEAPASQSGAENPPPPDGEEVENAAEAAELDAEAETMTSPGGFSGKHFREDRQIEALQSELQSTRQELESLRTGALGNQVSTDEVRETYRRKLQAMMRHLAALGLSMWEGDDRGQEGTGPRVTPEALFRALQSLADENIQVTEAREADMRHYADDAMARLVELRRKFKALYTAYRDLRCLVEDRWPGPDPRPSVPHEDEIVGGTLEGLIRSEEEADRRTINRLRDQVSQLQAQLESMRLSRGAQANVMGLQARPTDPGVSNTAPAGPATGSQRTVTEDANGAAPARGGTDVAATEAASTPNAATAAASPSPIAAASPSSEPPRTDPATTARLSDSNAVRPHQAGDATGSAAPPHVPANTSSTSTGRQTTPTNNTADDPRVSIASSPPPPLGTTAPAYLHENASRPGTSAALPQLNPGSPPLATTPTQAQTQGRPTEASSNPNTTTMSPMAPTALPPKSPPAAPLDPDESFPASISPPAVLERETRSPPPPVALELQSLPVELPPRPPPPPPPPPPLLLPEGGPLEPTDERLEGAVVEVGPSQGGPAMTEMVARRTTDGSNPMQQQFQQVLRPPPSPSPLPAAAAAHPFSLQSPVEQQQRLPSPMPPPPPPQLSVGAPGPGPRAAPEPDPQLQVENHRLKEELGQLRRRLQAVSEFPAALELENQRLRDEVDSLAKKLQMAVSAASDASKAGSVVAMPSNTASEGLIRQLREFNQKKTSELQRRVQQSETRAVMAEEQLEQLQGYMTKASGTYQKEIVRLRSIIGQMETSMGAVKGSYLNLSPLEGVGGGGTLRPAAAVLEEIASRSGSFTRRASAQGQTVMTITTPRETRSGGSSRTPLISAGGGVPGGVLASAANPGGGGAAVSSKADDGLTHLPAL